MIPTMSEDEIRARVAALSVDYPLPGGALLREVFSQETQLFGLAVGMVGLVIQTENGAIVHGSAAGVATPPVERAYFELLERTSLVLARDAENGTFPTKDRTGRELGAIARSEVFASDPHPQQLRTSVSNGAAIQASWAKACDAAYQELCERDRTLRAWLGEVPLEACSSPLLGGALAGAYDVELRVVAAAAGGPHSPMTLHTAICLGFPRAAELPLMRGFAARETREQAVEAAEGEALQGLCFLSGEALPEQEPEPAPNPDFHQELYLLPRRHPALRAWFEGRAPKAPAALPAFDPADVRFVDLTPVELRDRLWVCKAVSPSALPLRFGELRELSGKGLPKELWVHPIS